MGEVAVFTKRCSVCGETKPASDFYRRTRSSDGLDYRCRVCNLHAVKEYQNRKREEMGEDAWREHKTQAVREYRRRNAGTITSEELSRRAYRAATSALRDAHREHFEALLHKERYERGLD